MKTPIQRFDIWRAQVEAIASAKTADIFKWANIPFDWKGQWAARRTPGLTADDLINAAFDAVDVISEPEDGDQERTAA